ncbi:MAG TPA: winged helix DNA-binding domain-containing protein, partial [Candidatus Limnocylindria bacterium]|nr:winged helix DNA-binding domain-containing protein [Candidatus Limnocylindria bacterium]
MAAPRKAKPVTLTLRALNRATLARQMLLARERTTPLRALERLVALQAQSPKPPFIGLWSRVEGFRREALGRLLLARKAVRATTLRGTLHLMTAKDYRSLRAAVQPALTLGAVSILRGRAKDLDLEPLLKEARGFFTGESRTFEELRDVLARRHPKADVRAMAYLVRMHLPLVQASDETDWGYPAKSEFTLAESWLNQALAENVGPEPLVLRYLSACGPASASDMQTWSGLPAASVREAFAVLRPKLEAHHDERGRELFDLPKAPRPPEDAEVPVRFLPEFDHLLHSHADRRRFVADAHRR